MSRIRVDTELLRTNAQRFHITNFELERLSGEIACVAASMPSYDGQLSGPSRSAGFEAQNKSGALAKRYADLAHQLTTLAADFEAADQGPIDWWNQFVEWVNQGVNQLGPFFTSSFENQTPASPIADTPNGSVVLSPTQTISATATPTVSPSNSPTSYLIQPGDTLSAIAARFGVTLAALLHANPQITNPDQIAAGETILIPTGAPDPNAYSHPPRYPGIGDKTSFSELPFPAELIPLAFQGFGRTMFALDPSNQQTWYKRTSGMHNGLDLMVPYNTPLIWRGNSNATVIGIDDSKNWGAGPHNIILKSNDFYFIFGHTSDRPVTIHPGDILQPGQSFGFTGNPGGEDGAGNDHLHLEIRPAADTSIAINPLSLFSSDLYKKLWDALTPDYAGSDNPESLAFFTMKPI